jgi:hypothetical protein
MRKIYLSLNVLLVAVMLCLFTLPSCSHKSDVREEDDLDEYDGPDKAAEFEYNRTKDPATGKIPMDKMWAAVLQTEQLKHRATNGLTNLVWTERGSYADAVGPSNGNTRPGNGITSGRVRAVWVDLADPSGKTVWVGGVDGGIWKTTDITASPATWTPINDFLSNLAVSGICQDPTNTNIMYFCTGEAYFNGDAVSGNGVFKSTDHGATWNQLSSTSTLTSCTKVLCDASGNVYLSTIGISVAVGLQRSNDGGSTWTSISPFSNTSRIPDFEISSTGAIHIVGGFLSAAGLSQYKYNNNAATATTANWSNPTTPFPLPTGGNERVEIACSGNTLYAASGNGTTAKIDAVYKSVDGGDNWTTTSTLTSQNITDLNGGGLCWYAQGIAIDPSNPNNVIVGSLNLLKSTDGGLSYSKLSDWVGTSGQYVHADIHNVTWYDNGNKLLVGCDGGVFYTTDKGVTFGDRNSGLRLKQFYSVAVHPSSTNYFLAGAQDNGVHQFNGAGLTTSIEVTGGDGGNVAIDQDEPQFQVGSYINCNFRRSANGGASWSSGPSNSNGQFINPFDYDNTANKVYAGYSANNYLRWENPQSGFTYTPVSLTALGGSVSSVTVSPYTANRVYFGTTAGKIVMADNADATPTATVITPAGATGYVNSVIVGSSDQNLIATYSSYNVTQVWVSTNGGTTWVASVGNLPNMPVYWALYNPEDNTKAYIATETGVWSTTALNGSSTVWAPETSFPTVKTEMLKYRPSDRTMAAATHGRGLWTTTIPNSSCTPASVTSQPANASVCEGTLASFSVVAAGSAPLTYQWEVSTGGPFSAISGANAATYSFTATAGQTGNQYHCVVTGNCAPLTATSNAATLTVNPAANITTQPVNTSACAGTNTSFNVVATSVTSYKWQISTDGGLTFADLTNTAPYSGVSTATLTITNATAALNNNQYRVLLNNSCTVTSNAATLTVSATVNITSQPQATAACSGSNASFSVTATGAGLTYSWETATALAGPYTPVAGAPSSPTLTLAAVTPAMNGNFYRVVINGSCAVSPVTSNAVILTVNSYAVITSQPANATICAGTNTTFSIVATGASTYKWQVSTDGGNTYTDVAAAAPYSGNTTSTLTITNATAGLTNNKYRVIINIATCAVTSAAGTLVVNTAPAITAQPQATAVCNGTNASFSVSVTGTGLTYSWETATTLAGPYTAVAGAPSSATLTLTAVTPAMNGNYYRVVVTGTCPSAVTSNAVMLTVNTVAVIGTQPSNATACFSTVGTSTSFSVAATGTGLAYKWQVSTDGGSTFADVPNAAPYSGNTSATLNILPVALSMNNYQYRVLVTSTCTPTGTLSNAATLTVVNPVSIVTSPVAFKGCVGNTATFTVVATGSTITYQWQSSADGVTYTNLTDNGTFSGTTTATLTITNIATWMTNYRFRVIATGTPCGSATTVGVPITVNITPSAVLTAASFSSINPGTPSELTTTVSPTGTYTYSYTKNGVAQPSFTGPIVPLNVDLFGTYNVTVTDVLTGCFVKSNTVIIKDSASGTLFIYPNPTSGRFQVRYFNNGGTATVRSLNVFDHKGSRVYYQQYPVNAIYERMDVDLTKYPAGIYIVELTDATGKRLATGSVRKE